MWTLVPSTYPAVSLTGCRCGRVLALLLLLCGAGMGAGCAVSPEDIARWKTTEKGPGKLRAALGRADLQPELRALAAVALIDIGRGEDVEAALGEMDEGPRRAIMHLALPRLVTVVQGASEGAPPSRSQIEAKDGLFRLRLLGDPDDRRLAEEALVAFCVADLPGRMSAGLYGTERVLLAIGGRAQGALLAVLGRASLGSPALLPAASLLGRIGDAEARRAGAEGLVRLLRPAVAGEVAKDKVRAVDDALRALGLLGSTAGGVFLMELAERGEGKLRGKAFAALRETGDPRALDLALRVAWDRREPGGVREAAFAYLERAGQIAVDGLCKIIADPKDPSKTGDTARFRAVEAALSAGGPAAVGKVLAALPETRAYEQEEFTSLVVRQLTSLGPSARPAVRAALQSPSWVGKAAALLALGEAGVPAEDLPAMEALARDGTKLNIINVGGAGVKTVGELARRQADRLRQKAER